MGTPTQTEGPSSVDKSHKAILSDVFPTDRDPRSINLPISRGKGYQNDITAATCYSKILILISPQKATALDRFLPVMPMKRGSQLHTNACSSQMQSYDQIHPTPRQALTHRCRLQLLNPSTANTNSNIAKITVLAWAS